MLIVRFKAINPEGIHCNRGTLRAPRYHLVVGTETGHGCRRMKTERVFEWSVAILSSRESFEVLRSTIAAAITACGTQNAVIDVVINGNERLAEQAAGFAQSFQQDHTAPGLRVWSIPCADKSNAWNLHVHHIEPHAQTAFFVDGYAQVMPDAFTLIAGLLHDKPSAYSATGVPTCGRSAAKLRASLLAKGGIHGNLYALRRSVMDEFRRTGFHLPIGMYRTDALVGAVLCFDFDPARNKWNAEVLSVHPDATWQTPERKITNIKDVLGYIKRMRRQGRGVLVNEALKKYLFAYECPPQDLPEFADDLIMTWARSSKRQVASLCVRNLLCVPALVAAYRGRDFPFVEEPPHMLIAVGRV